MRKEKDKGTSEEITCLTRKKKNKYIIKTSIIIKNNSTYNIITY